MGTFAIAALVVAVLLADRIGPPEVLKRRFFQLSVATAAVLLVLALSATFFPPPKDFPEAFDLLSEGDPQIAHILKERLTFVVATAFVLLLAAFYQSSVVPTLSLAMMLAGLLLIFASVGDLSSGSFISFYYEAVLDGGSTRNAVYSVITALGLFLLLMYGYNEWDKRNGDGIPAEADSATG
jgi:Na+/H+ antiporter NhaD/arsenite permease-like protein